jgi:hypothetical protein
MIRTLRTAFTGRRKATSREGRRGFRPELGELEPRLVMTTGTTLTAPWYTFRNELAATVGMTPQVVVSPLVQLVSGGDYFVTVTTANASRGVALATVLQGSQEFGNINVHVVVNDPKGNIYHTLAVTSATQLAGLEATALGGNPLLQSFVIHPIAPGGAVVVFPVFTRSVVQFPNDNLADAFGNFNAVTASVFGEVLAGDVDGFLVSPSTAK